MIGASQFVPRPSRIRRVLRETHDTFTLEIEAPADATFAPGQFAMLYVFGVGEVPISLSGDPARTDTLVHTTRAVGTVTTAMRRLRKGGALGVRGPYGRPWPLAEATGKDVVLVAGGIGLAPLRSALYALAARRREFGRVALLYGARGPEDILFSRQLQRWGAAADMQVFVTVDRATPEWRGNVGVVTGLIPRAVFDPANAVALVCGPEVMMRFTAAALRKRGMPEDGIYISLERNMKCAVGLCGRCQFGPAFVCKDGPVFVYERVASLLELREV